MSSFWGLEFTNELRGLFGPGRGDKTYLALIRNGHEARLICINAHEARLVDLVKAIPCRRSAFTGILRFAEMVKGMDLRSALGAPPVRQWEGITAPGLT